MMSQKISIDEKRKNYAMTKVQLYHAMQVQIDPAGAILEQVKHSLWQIKIKGQVVSKFILKNSKNWADDPRATDLVGHYKFRSWNSFAESDLDADVDYFVFAITRRQPADIQLIVLTPTQLKQLWDDPRRKMTHGAKPFYFSQLLNGRLGDSRFAKGASKNYDGWIDLPKSVLNNYDALLGKKA